MRIRRKLTKRHLVTLITLLVAAALGLTGTGSLSESPAISNPSFYRVTGVSDGDTITVSRAGFSDIVRLIGVDTPETKDPRKPVQCFGQASANYTKQILLGKDVRLEAEPADDNRDKYGRLLRYVYFAENGTLFNAQLIREGYAFAYTVFPYGKMDEFRRLEAEARTDNRGLWGGCQVDESTKVKQTNTN